MPQVRSHVAPVSLRLEGLESDNRIYFLSPVRDLSPATRADWQSCSHVQSVAEEVGFEPTVGLHLHRFSRPALSTTQAPLLVAVAEPGFEPIARRARVTSVSHFTKCPAFLEEFFEDFAALFARTPAVIWHR